jgi:nitric oxide reductase NorE protein
MARLRVELGHFSLEGIQVTEMDPPARLPPSDTNPDHPGTSGIWTFVFIDMIVFLLLFVIYLSERHRLPDLFATSQATLEPLVGLASTIFLLTSSWCMAESVHSARSGSAPRAAAWLNATALLGAAFVANKLWEYADKLEHGISPVTNGFFTFYFIITGLHFAHVIGGLCFIAHCRMRVVAEAGTSNYRKKIENVGLFWHIVDMLWLFIFPMLYLAGIQ